MDSEAILQTNWKPSCVLESGEDVESDFDLPADLPQPLTGLLKWGNRANSVISWSFFDTFCVSGTQDFKANLILTFKKRLVEVEVTQVGEVL